MNILVLCTGNSCRSQMAEGYLRHFLGKGARVYSAGIETHGLNPRAVKTMAEDGIDISHHSSTHIDELRHIPFDLVLTVCDHAQENCPIFPSTAQRVHQNFIDPAKATGAEHEIELAFRNTRIQIKRFCETLAKDLKRNS